MSDYVDFLKTTQSLAREMQSLHALAVTQYTPLVEYLITNGSCDVQLIEQTLDGLLGFCCDKQALELFRSLCRHYFTIDPVATASYINSYREMWDSDEVEK